MATLDGNRFTVTARHVVRGGRRSRSTAPAVALELDAPDGLGNDHDLVGRYFMDHIEGSVGTARAA